MPPVEGLDHVVEYFFAVGPTAGGGDPITFQELACWAALSGVELSPWDAGTLHQMSRAYAGELHAAAAATRQAPFSASGEVKPPRDEVAARLLAAFRSMAGPEAEGPDAEEEG